MLLQLIWAIDYIWDGFGKKKIITWLNVLGDSLMTSNGGSRKEVNHAKYTFPPITMATCLFASHAPVTYTYYMYKSCNVELHLRDVYRMSWMPIPIHVIWRSKQLDIFVHCVPVINGDHCFKISKTKLYVFVLIYVIENSFVFGKALPCATYLVTYTLLIFELIL